jgi:hypothetical protein
MYTSLPTQLMVTTLERSKDKSIICWIFEKSSLQPRLLLIPGVSSKPNTSILHCWSYGLECASQSVGNVTCSVIEIYLTSHHSLLVTSACLPCSASCHVMETLGQACGSSNEAPACGMLLRLVSLELSSRFASGRKNTHKPLVAAVPLSVFTLPTRAIVLLHSQHMRHANCLPPPSICYLPAALRSASRAGFSPLSPRVDLLRSGAADHHRLQRL